jgi:hypothetical protein
MTISVSNNTPRVSYTVAQGQTQTSFTVNFEFFAEADLNVYVDGTLKTLTTNYSVSGGSGSTGAVAISVTGATGGSTVVITRDIALERTTDFPTQGAFNITSLNTELDKLVAIDADVDDTISRSIRLQDQDATASMELPLKASRVGTVLGFNATTGAAEAGPTITAVQSLADVTTSINLLGTSAVVEDMGLLATSAVIEDMGLLATSSNISAMALLGTSAVITDMGLLGTSDVVADMALLATTDVIADMNTLATSDIISDLNTLATSDIVTDMNLLATSDNVTAMGLLGTSSNVTAMGLLGTSAVVTDMGLLGTSDNVTAMGLLGTSANVTAMGLLGTSAVVTDMNLLGTSAVVTDMDLLATSSNITNMATLGASGVVANIATVAGVSSNVTTVANNISGVNSFAERYRVASSAPSSSLDEGDLYYDTTSNALNYYNGSSWEAIVAGAMTSLASDTTPQLGGNLDVNGQDIVSTSNAHIDIIPNGTGNVNLGTDTVMIGDNNADATITTQGTGDLTLSTNSGTNSGTVTIADGVNGNISITPNGSGAVVLDGLSHPTADGSAGQFLKTDGSGTLSFSAVDTDLSNDSSPQLGGDLDANSNDILMGSQSVKFGTSKWEIVLDGNDLDFKYNGSTVFKLASNGAVTSADNITAFGSP